MVEFSLDVRSACRFAKIIRIFFGISTSGLTSSCGSGSVAIVAKVLAKGVSLECSNLDAKCELDLTNDAGRELSKWDYLVCMCSESIILSDTYINHASTETQMSPRLRSPHLALADYYQNHGHVVALGRQDLAVLYYAAYYLIWTLFSLKLVIFFADKIGHFCDAHRLEDAVSRQQNEIIFGWIDVKRN
jgi:hypothetical protein